MPETYGGYGTTNNAPEGYAKTQSNTYEALAGVNPDPLAAGDAPKSAFEYITGGDIQSKYDSFVDNQYNSVKDLVTDPNEIRQQYINGFQDRINALNQVYDSQLATAKQQGLDRVGQGTAILARRGIAGSPRAVGIKEGILTQNRGIESEIQAQRNAEIGALLGQASQMAVEEARYRAEQKQNGVKSYLEELKGRDQRAQDMVGKNVAALIAGGYDINEIDVKDLAKRLGVNTQDILSQYQTEKIKQDAAAKEAVLKGQYNLAPGEIRFDANGKEVARGGDKPQTGIIGEYEYAKAQGYSGSFTEYQNDDANRRATAASIAAANGQLNPQQTSTFLRIVDKYNASPLIQASDRTPVLKDTITRIRANPGDAAQQLNLSYAYIQALDTYQSAVREGELGLVNSIDSKIGKLQNSVQQIQNGQVVRPEVALQIANAANDLVTTINAAAQQKARSFQSGAQVAGVGPAFDQYLSGFNPTYESGNSNNGGNYQVPKIKPQSYGSVSDVIKANPDKQTQIDAAVDQMISDGLQDDEILQRLQGGSQGFNDVVSGINVKKVADAIGKFESGGNYRALGPVTNASGNRAYGKYQVMASNVPSWTKEALGKSLTPQQFLNDPKAQDAVAHYKMKQYLTRYGSVEDVASVWFSGQPASKAGNKKDVIGTSVPSYIKNVLAHYNA